MSASRQHSRDAVRLCEHIVRQAFGDVVCRIASVLLNRGRLPLPSIARLSSTPRLTSCASLLILMQHNLVQSNGASNRDSSEGEEMYEFIVEECLHRLRFGRILAMTEDRYGYMPMEVVRMVMVYGKIDVRGILEVMRSYDDGQRMSDIHEALLLLVRNSLLVPVTPELQVLASDQIAKRFASFRSARLREGGMNLPSATDLKNMADTAVNQITAERLEHQAMSKILIQSARGGKRKKKGEEEFEYSLREDVPLRINHDRFAVLIRDELVVKAAEDRWNKGTAEVMRAVLEASLCPESTILDTRTHQEIGFNEIISKIPNSTYPLLSAGLAGSSSKSTTEIVRQYLNILSGEDQKLNNHSAFLFRKGGMNPTYQVELEYICTRLRSGLLSELVRQRLGEKAARVLAVVTKAQKASETTVRDCAMIPLKDARRVLSELQKLSIVETQEVPKTGAKIRTGLPSSAEYHLWQVDLPRVYSTQLSGVYKTIGNIIQRRASELEKREVARAREASSARYGGGKERLQAKDQEDLAELNQMIRKLGTAELRSDLVAFILRDLPGWPR